ncbi:MAG TPA: sigma-70 family RNA polymerase sigma factor [Vicinamibacterales bacterium]|nr:sigma-70 family RNA polymerase sigma factor [Vicinamibacterales bacterium]
MLHVQEAARLNEDADVTQILQRWHSGDEAALEDLVRAIYPELRRIAAGQLRRERAGHSLRPTALAHDVYLRLLDQRRVTWQNRAHFLAIAAKLTRRLLIDHARRRAAWKRGFDVRPVSLDDVDVAAPDAAHETDLVALDEALSRLALLDPRQARVVELRFFGGLSIEETASVLGSSPATVKRDWVTARLWLFEQLRHR